jgi:hypothetical protein
VSKCFARQYSDQKICHQCGLVWDTNDPDPPACKRQLSLYHFVLGLVMTMYLSAVVCAIFFDMRLSFAFGAASGMFVILAMLINIRSPLP